MRALIACLSQGQMRRTLYRHELRAVENKYSAEKANRDKGGGMKCKGKVELAGNGLCSEDNKGNQ